MTEVRGASRLVPAGAGVLAFLVYAAGAAREITGEDAGQLATAAFEAGIPHPPGYPLWCLLAHAASSLLPFGAPCFRVALLSAGCGGLAAALSGALVLRLGGGAVAALAAAALLAASRTLWSQALVVEVYTMNAALLAALLLLFERWKERPGAGRLAALAFVSGLALTHHPTMRLFVPLVVLAVVLSRPFPARRAVLAALAAGLAGLLPLLYLPVRSAADPFMDWGNPETPRGFLDHVLRLQYSSGVPDSASGLSPGPVSERLLAYAKSFAAEWTGPLGIPALVVLGVGVAGFFVLRARASAWLLAAILVAGGPAIVVLLGLDVAARDVGNVGVYAHAALVPLAVLFGVGLASFPAALRPLGLLPSVLAASSHLPSLGKAEYPWVADWARNALDGVEPNAAILAYADDQIFPLFYVQRVEGRRPDVLLLGNYNAPHRALLERMDAKTKERLRRLPGKERRPVEEAFLVGALAPRPVYFTEPREFDSLPEVRVVPCGVLFRLVRAREADPSAACESALARYRWRFREEERPPDPPAAAVLASLRLARGFAALAFGDRSGALAEFRRIEAEGIGADVVYLNAGSALANAGAFEEAIPFFEESLRRNPRSLPAAQNLALAAVLLYARTRDADRARALIERAGAFGPLPAEAASLRDALRSGR